MEIIEKNLIFNVIFIFSNVNLSFYVVELIILLCELNKKKPSQRVSCLMKKRDRLQVFPIVTITESLFEFARDSTIFWIVYNVRESG